MGQYQFQCSESYLSKYISVLTHVFNLSIRGGWGWGGWVGGWWGGVGVGFLLKELKIARVIPLFKSDNCMLVINYRTVSVLPFFSKILEKIMYNRILAFINKHNLLYKFQFGFRGKHGTDIALIVLVAKIMSAFNDGEMVLGVFLDLSKAFDTVDHDILLNKLDTYGIRGTAHDWFRSYLFQRKQFVAFNGSTSNESTIKCGVPQGSILGPLLFLLYINDMVNASAVLFSLLFADDTNVFVTGKNLSNLVESMNTELKKVDRMDAC